MDVEGMLAQIAKLWPIDEASFVPFHDKVNALLRGRLTSGEEVLIRITHSLHRSLKRLEASAHLNNVLNALGIHLPRYLLSNEKQYAHRIMRRARPFFVSISFFVQGDSLVSGKEGLSKERAFQLGQKIGRLHQLTETLPKAQKDALPLFSKDSYLSELALTGFDENINRLCRKALETIESSEHGLIVHQINPANVCLLKGDLVFLDDDWLCFGPKAMDLLSPLYVAYGFSSLRKDYALEFKVFAKELLHGYQLEGGKAPSLEELRALVVLRDIFNLSLCAILINRKDQLEPMLLPYQTLIYQRLLENKPALSDEFLNELSLEA